MQQHSKVRLRASHTLPMLFIRRKHPKTDKRAAQGNQKVHLRAPFALSPLAWRAVSSVSFVSSVLLGLQLTLDTGYFGYLSWHNVQEETGQCRWFALAGYTSCCCSYCCCCCRCCRCCCWCCCKCKSQFDTWSIAVSCLTRVLSLCGRRERGTGSGSGVGVGVGDVWACTWCACMRFLNDFQRIFIGKNEENEKENANASDNNNRGRERDRQRGRWTAPVDIELLWKLYWRLQIVNLKFEVFYFMLCLSYFRCPLLPSVVLSHICKRAMVTNCWRRRRRTRVVRGRGNWLGSIAMPMMMAFYYAHFGFYASVPACFVHISKYHT